MKIIKLDDTVNFQFNSVEIENYFNNLIESIKRMYNDDISLITNSSTQNPQLDYEENVGEQSIIFRIALYFQNNILKNDSKKNIVVDYNYNRFYSKEEDTSHNKTGSELNLILHERLTTENNLVVCEFIGYWDKNVEIKLDEDMKKVFSYCDPKGKFRYQIGLVVYLDKNYFKIYYLKDFIWYEKHYYFESYHKINEINKKEVFNKVIYRIKGNQHLGDIVFYEDRFECKSDWIEPKENDYNKVIVEKYDDIANVKVKKGALFAYNQLEYFSIIGEKKVILINNNWETLKKIEKLLKDYITHKEKNATIDSAKIKKFTNDVLRLNKLNYSTNYGSLDFFESVSLMKSEIEWARLNDLEKKEINKQIYDKTCKSYGELCAKAYSTLFSEKIHGIGKCFNYDNKNNRFYLEDEFKKSHIQNINSGQCEDKTKLICYIHSDEYGLNYYGIKNVTFYKCPVCGNIDILYYACDKKEFMNRNIYGKNYECGVCHSSFETATIYSAISEYKDQYALSVLFYDNLNNIINRRNEFLTKEIYNYYSIDEPKESYSFEEIFEIINHKLNKSLELLNIFMLKKGNIAFNYLSQIMFNYYIAMNYPVKNEKLIINIENVNFYNCMRNFDLTLNRCESKRITNTFIDEFKRLINAFYDYLREERFLEIKKVMLSDLVVTITIIINDIIVKMNYDYFKTNELLKYDSCKSYDDFINRFVEMEIKDGTMSNKIREFSGNALDIFSEYDSLKYDVSCILRKDILSLYYFLIKQKLIKIENNQILNQFDKFINDIVKYINYLSDDSQTFDDYLYELNNYASETEYYRINDIDLLDGITFERVICNLLIKMGYKSTVTKSSGDQGIDIIAYKGNVKYGIQTKRYSNKVTNTAIQEVAAGLRFYACDSGMVITNSYFTQSAKELANANNIMLWDREELEKRLNEYKIEK